MTTSFFNGITGLKSFEYGIDVWGNNIANINTTGYKEQVPEFSTLFANEIKNSPVCSDVGMGSKLSSTAINMTEGSLIQTENPFDLSITGKGWFAVQNGNSTYYTRTGSFKRDADGFLVDDNGDRLLVANANNLIKKDDGTFYLDRNINTSNLINQTTKMTPISLPNNVTLPAVATTEANLTTNLTQSDPIKTTKPASEDNDFSALYSKDAQDLKIRNGDSLVFGFGNPATYDNGLISTDICIKNDIKDGKDETYNFSVNGKQFNIDIPDGSTKEEIQQKLKSALDSAGIMNKITDNGIEISDPEKIIIKSDNTLVPDTAVAKITYEGTPQSEYQFSTIKDFDNILQNLANEIYSPGDVNVSLDDEGRISITNNTFHTVNAYADKTEHSNDMFMSNLGRLGNEIYEQTSSKSFAFLTNTQQFGGNIIQANGQKDTLSMTFQKQKTLNNQTVWNAKIDVLDPDSKLISSKEVQLTFDQDGHLLSPKSVELTDPQNVTLNFNLTSYNKSDSSTSYSYSQNGVEEGYLNKYQVNSNGDIQAIFSNGQMQVVGQIPIYHFQNSQGLESIGNNLFKATDNSNKAILYQDTNGNYISGSSISSGTLEASNVNFSQAMTELIVIQKAYSSAAKTVTTSDEMIKTAINMKQ